VARKSGFGGYTINFLDSFYCGFPLEANGSECYTEYVAPEAGKWAYCKRPGFYVNGMKRTS